ncbi:hypothetical protein [Gandjariella thermophila]|uniref:Uncharacterized protein n=1 Tax=Gandjariella thermophila TaxID=1931992 RepID=A0A4D4JI29_9PSEU|nr:hypothetical protein [Gandjariella thermophila]GDY34066.1 hypothetical protein GTS_56990 [Gandjariella thermophila]
MSEDHRSQRQRRPYRSRYPIKIGEPEIIAMTDEQRQDAISALSRLEDFMRFTQSRKVEHERDADDGA